jgi:ferredoxin
MKPTVNEDLCTGCGSCEELCPEVFRLEDDGFSHVICDEPGPELYGCVREAAEECPSGAITIKE